MKSLTAALFLTLYATAASHADEIEDNMLKAAQRCSDAGVEKNWEAVADSMPPAIVEAMGGRARVIEKVQAVERSMTADNSFITKATVSKPIQRKEINLKIYAIIPQALVIKVPQGMLHHKGFMLGISDKPYTAWHFISITRGMEAGIKEMFPDLAEGFEFPVHEKPVLEPK